MTIEYFLLALIATLLSDWTISQIQERHDRRIAELEKELLRIREKENE